MAVPQASAGRSPALGRGMIDAGLSFSSSVLLGIISALLISRIYGIAVVGEFALLTAPYAMAMQFSTFGEQLAMVRSLSLESARSARTVSLFLVVLAFSTLLTTIATIISTLLAYALLRYVVHRADLFVSCVTMLLFYLFIGNVSWNIDRLLASIRATRALLGTRLVELVGVLTASILFGVLSPPDAWGLVWATVTAGTLALSVRVLVVRRLVTGRPTRESIRAASRELPDLIRFGANTVPGTIANGISGPAGTWVVGAVRSIDVLGGYSRAYNLASRLNEAGYRLGEVILTVLSAACQDERHDVAAAQFSRWRFSVITGLLAACVPLAGAGHGVLAVFGPGFAQTWVAFGVLLVAFAMSVLSVMHCEFLYALGSPKRVSQMWIARSVLTLATVAPFTLVLGATGTAISVGLGFLIELIGTMTSVERRLREKGQRTKRLPWISLALATALSYLTARVVDAAVPSLAGTAIALTGGITVFLVVLVAYGVVRPREVRESVSRLGLRR